MACCLFGAKPFSESMMPYCQLDPKEHISVKFYSRLKIFHSRKCAWKCRLRNGIHFIWAQCVNTSLVPPCVICWSCGCDVCKLIFNTLRLRQYSRHFADDVFICIFLDENVWILLKISLKFVPKGPIYRPGYKPLSEPMMVSLLTNICIPRPQWVKRIWYMLVNYRPLSLYGGHILNR